MKMRCCDSCKFVGERVWKTIPSNGTIPEIPVRQGFCFAVPPTALNQQKSQFPAVHLWQSCGFHSYGWAGFWRAVGRLWTRES